MAPWEAMYGLRWSYGSLNLKATAKDSVAYVIFQLSVFIRFVFIDTQEERKF